MPKDMEFRIAWVPPSHDVGETVETKPDKLLITGERIWIKIP